MIRIQLASNFQVVELTYDTNTYEDLDPVEIDLAVDLVNRLGKQVNSTSSEPIMKKEVIPPTIGQFNLAEKLKIDITKMSKKEAAEAIKEAIEKAKK